MMYIRWKRSALRRSADVTLKAFLVHSVRVEGRPQQRILGYLGAIREHYQQAPAHRQRFWHQVAQRLPALGVDPRTQATLEACLARVVPRLTPTDLAALEAQRTALPFGERGSLVEHGLLQETGPPIGDLQAAAHRAVDDPVLLHGHGF